LSGEELLDLQFILSTRNKSPLSLAFIDIDNFKLVNDNYGHEKGDQVLASVADSMRGTLRSGEMLVRWGGEEFIIIFPGAYCTNSLEAIERLREKGLGTRPDGQPITVSIGLAERTRDSTADWRQLVETADHRMYLAKQFGKDQVVC
jgi:diguanylate cyclase (GGDEF)-like protein